MPGLSGFRHAYPQSIIDEMELALLEYAQHL
jgi:hypothetical protein